MRITSLSLVLSFPLLIILAILFPLALTYEYQYIFPWLIIPIILLISIYFLKPQIDYWWISRNPPPLDKKLISWLNANSKYYGGLSLEGKQQFELRAQLFLHSKDYSIKAVEDHPVGEEFKMIAIHEALRITEKMDNYQFDNFDRIILYPHPFPSPQYKYLHTTELHEEDGMVLMSQPHLVNGLLFPKNYFNIGLFTWVSAFIRENPRLKYPMISDEQFEKLNDVFPFSIDQIKEVTGHHFISPMTLHICAYFDFRDNYLQTFSDLGEKLSGIFE